MVTINQWLQFCFANFNIHLFQLTVCLNPDFNCYSSFVLSWVDRVTTGTQSFVSVIANVVALTRLKRHNMLTMLK